MNLKIVGDRIHLTPAIKFLIDEKINQRIGKFLTHLSSDIQVAAIWIQKEKLGLFKVNFDMELPGQKHVYAETEHILLESALVDLSHQVEKQIKKYCHRSGFLSLSTISFCQPITPYPIYPRLQA